MNDLTLGSYATFESYVDKDGEIAVTVDGGLFYMNKEHAIQVVEHLTEVFQLQTEEE